jgi:ESS family glutamate:Na+ symporter
VPTVITLDMIQTVALAAVVLFLGYGIRRRVGVLDRFNIPAPVVGGFLFAATALALRQAGILAFEFDSALQTPFMVAFFTTIGLGASVGLLRVGGPQVLLFWGLASLLAAVQNGVGIALARLLGVNPLLGVLTGSITMTGGHGTGAAFGKLLEEQYAFPGAVTIAMAAATFGLVSGGLIGGPVGTRLIRRFGLTPRPAAAPPPALEHAALDEEIDTEPAGEAPTAYTLLKTLTVILVAMWAGSLLSAWLGRYVTLPGLHRRDARAPRCCATSPTPPSSCESSSARSTTWLRSRSRSSWRWRSCRSALGAARPRAPDVRDPRRAGAAHGGVRRLRHLPRDGAATTTPR